METQRQSRLGVVSLVFGGISAVSVFITFLRVGEEMLGGLKVASSDSMSSSMGSLVFFFVTGIFGFFIVGLSVLGAVFGIAGIRAKESKRVFAVLGLVLSVATLLIAVVVFRHPLIITATFVISYFR